MSSFINPYKEKLLNFPARLLTFNDFEKDLEQVHYSIANSVDIYCEIGSGSGGFMLEHAKENPQAHFFGFELRFKRSVRTIEKAIANNLNNISVLLIKGERIAELFPAASISGVYVNFPEPWHKNRWKKHRVLTLDLLQKLLIVLRKDGFIALKTDDIKIYYDFKIMLSQSSRFMILEESSDLHYSDYEAKKKTTEFERMFICKGEAIKYIKVKKL